MAEESEIFVFSPESYAFGATITIHLWTLYSSINLYSVTKSKWYMATALLAVGRICEVCMSVRIMVLGVPGDLAALEVVQQVISCGCQVAFAWMRTRRFQQLSTPATTRRWLSTLIQVLTVVSVALSVLLNLLGIVGMFIPATLPHIGATYLPFMLYDALVHLLVCASVVSALRAATSGPPQIVAASKESGHVATDTTAATRKSELLGVTKVERIAMVLGSESIVMVALIATLNASATWDPFWSSVYLGWAVEGRCFCEYVDLAGRIMGSAGGGGKSVPQSGATSSFAQSSDGVHRAGQHGGGSSMGKHSETIPPGAQVETMH